MAAGIGLSTAVAACGAEPPIEMLDAYGIPYIPDAGYEDAGPPHEIADAYGIADSGYPDSGPPIVGVDAYGIVPLPDAGGTRDGGSSDAD